MKKLGIHFYILLLVFFFVVAGNAKEQNKPQTAQSLYEQGYQLRLQAKYQEAINCFDKTLALDSTNILAWCEKGVALYKLRHMSEANNAFDSALNLDKDCIYAIAYKAFVVDTNMESEKLLEQAVHIWSKENDAVTSFALGFANMRLAKYDRAIANYTEAIKINPQYAEAYLYRGDVHFTQGMFEQELANRDPQYSGTTNNRGFTYDAQRKFDRAVADYTKALTINPQYVEAYLIRGHSFGYQKEYKQAIADYTKAIEINPQCADAYLDRGIILYSINKEYKSAKRDCEKALELDPTGFVGKGARSVLQIIEIGKSEEK